MEKWDETKIPDLSGKTIIVTGGNTGLGFEAVKLLAQNNAEVILTARDTQRGENAKQRIVKEYPDVNIKVKKLDLGDLQSIHAFAEAFNEENEQLDVLLNNAGIMWCPYAETKDGFESQMGVNHLGHFALTGLLFEKLKETPKSRVVTVSSLGHRRAQFDIDNPIYNKENYNHTVAYFNSKLSNLLFTYELQRRLKQHGLDIISVAAHPGGSNTNLSRHSDKRPLFRLLKPLFYLMSQSAEMGTLPEVRASVDAKVEGGEYYGPGGFYEARGYPIVVESTKESHNKEHAKKLWELSEELTGVSYSFK